MSAHCCNSTPTATQDPKYRRALWIALAVNALMFGVEIVGSTRANSVSLLADAIDFLGDAANYGVSLSVLTLGLLWRARAALLKGLCMGAFGIFVLAQTTWNVAHGVLPEPTAMGIIGILALLANLSVAVLLFAWRSGDANMRSVWLCTRNDAIGNVAVLLAAAGVFGTGSGWPDWTVALLMGALALSAATSVIRQARAEIAEATSHGHAH